MDGNESRVTLDNETTVFLLTGIANPTPLLNHVKSKAKQIVHHNYPDHHQFTLKNIAKLADEFAACIAEKKLVITTEKDIQRLREHDLLPAVKQLQILVISIEVQFLDSGGLAFDKTVKDYVR